MEALVRWLMERKDRNQTGVIKIARALRTIEAVVKGKV